MKQYIVISELTRRIEELMPESKAKWYLARATPNEHILRYAFLNRKILKDLRILSASVFYTADLLYSFDEIPHSSYLSATTDALFSQIDHCFVPHDGKVVELEKKDGISEYLTGILNELDIKIEIIEKGQIISMLMSTHNMPAYYIEPLKK
ncbi:MAG: hypothetical protein KAI53_05750 [Candidatus Aenigmarchaeota archaeon]|nr:hypothetical protein [Candidatus Aenigmarchaeota archaeon]